MNTQALVRQDARLLLFTTLVYCVLGAPIPESIGLPELVVGGGLTILVLRQYIFRTTMNAPNVALYISVMWLLFVPTVFGLGFHGNSFGDFIRDFFPVLFMLVPYFMMNRLDCDPHYWVSYISNLLIVSGAVLSFRYIETSGANFDVLSLGETVPLNQCPSVIYSAVAAFYFSLRPYEKFYIRLAYGFAAILCLSGLMLTVMRAQIAIILLCWLLILMFLASKSMKSLFYVVSTFVLVLIFVLSNYLGEIRWTLEMIVAKSESAGLLNSRDAEFFAIVNLMSSNIWVLLFGEGWGSTLYLQTADKIVKYTHNSTLFYLWKLGVFGFVFYLVYWFSVSGLMRAVRLPGYLYSNAPLFLACGASLFIFGVVEMGYKIITYSMVFMVIRCLILSSLAGGNNAKIFKKA